MAKKEEQKLPEPSDSTPVIFKVPFSFNSDGSFEKKKIGEWAKLKGKDPDQLAGVLSIAKRHVSHEVTDKEFDAMYEGALKNWR